MRRKKPVRLHTMLGRGNRRDDRLRGRNARGHEEDRDAAGATALGQRMLQIERLPMQPRRLISGSRCYPQAQPFGQRPAGRL
jgi:hypothetical protein